MAHGAENRRTPVAVLHLSTGPFGTAVPVSAEPRPEGGKKENIGARVAGANWLMPVITVGHDQGWQRELKIANFRTGGKKDTFRSLITPFFAPLGIVVNRGRAKYSVQRSFLPAKFHLVA